MKTGVTVCNETLDPLREGRAADELSKRLVFYEVEGNRLQQGKGSGASAWAELNRQVEQKIKKAIERTSGGLTTATPCHLIVEQGKNNEPAVRVRVQFMDFQRDAKGRVEKAEYTVQYKTLFPNELTEAQVPALQGDSVQRFLLDFGDGPVPVQPVHFELNAKAEGVAYFIELTDLDNVRNGKSTNKVWVRVHVCNVGVLRFLPDGHRSGPDVFQKALATYSRLRKEGKRIIPQCLELAPPFQVPGGMGIAELREYLKVLISRHKAGAPRASVNQFEVKEDELIPFGTYEDFSR